MDLDRCIAQAGRLVGPKSSEGLEGLTVSWSFSGDGQVVVRCVHHRRHLTVLRILTLCILISGSQVAGPERFWEVV